MREVADEERGNSTQYKHQTWNQEEFLNDEL